MIKNKKGQKEVLVIVRGIAPYKRHFKNKTFDKFRESILNFLTSNPGILDEDYGNMIEFFKKDYKIIETLNWDGNVWKHHNIDQPIEELQRILKNYKKVPVDILAVSIGGAITEKVLSANEKIKVNKLIYLGAVHQKKEHNLKNVKKTINVYSNADKLFFLANDIYKGIGGAIIAGKNVINIALNGIAHDKWCRNIALNEKFLKHKHLYELYRDLLWSS